MSKQIKYLSKEQQAQMTVEYNCSKINSYYKLYDISKQNIFNPFSAAEIKSQSELFEGIGEKFCKLHSMECKGKGLIGRVLLNYAFNYIDYFIRQEKDKCEIKYKSVGLEIDVKGVSEKFEAVLTNMFLDQFKIKSFLMRSISYDSVEEAPIASSLAKKVLDINHIIEGEIRLSPSSFKVSSEDINVEGISALYELHMDLILGFKTPLESTEVAHEEL